MKIKIFLLLFILPAQFIISQSSIEDADGDTRVDTEDAPDDDKITFRLTGIDRFIFDEYRIEVLGSGESVFIGLDAGVNFIGAPSRIVGIGGEALLSLTSGDQNTAIGANASRALTTGVQNVAIGEAAMLSNTTGSRNTVVGQSAFRENLTGSNNVAIGEHALYGALGSDNVAIGQEAGRNAQDSCVMIGHNAGLSETGSNKLYIANSSTSSPLIYGEFDNDLLVINGTQEVSSDARLKEEITPYQNVLNDLMQLSAYEYRRKGVANRNRKEIGLLAQEVRKMVPHAVSENSEGYLSINYNAMIPILIEAIKEQQVLIEDLRSRIDQ